MWNPERYQDTDFGLKEGDSFEPDDLDSCDVDLSSPYVLTVLGPIDPGELGICQTAEKIPQNGNLEDVVAELEAFVTAGGRAIVDTNPLTVPYGLFLSRIAQSVPVHLVATHWVTDATVKSVVDPFETRSDAPHGAGIVACEAFGSPHVLDRAIALATGSGLPLRLVVSATSHVADVARLIDQGHISPARLIVGGVGTTTDIERLVQAGVWLAFDAIGDGYSEHSIKQAELISELVESGLGERILLSQGAHYQSTLRITDGLIWTGLTERFAITLLEAGVSASVVRTILMDNPARALVVAPTAGEATHGT